MKGLRRKLLGAFAAAATFAFACASDSGDSSSGAGDSREDFAPRACGNGAPCKEGSRCSYSLWENRVGCSCDPTGHMFCDLLQGGAAGPQTGCSTGQDCTDFKHDPDICTRSNGPCTRRCECPDKWWVCELECKEGAGGRTNVTPCGLESCQTDAGSPDYWGGCRWTEQGCTYSVDCRSREVTGSCDGVGTGGTGGTGG